MLTATEIAMALIQLVVQLVGMEEAKRSLTREEVRLARLAAEAAEIIKFRTDIHNED